MLAPRSVFDSMIAGVCSPHHVLVERRDLGELRIAVVKRERLPFPRVT